MSAMDFHRIKADVLGALGCFAIFLDGVQDFVSGHGTGNLTAGLGGDIGAGDGFHTGAAAGSGSTGVVDLDGDGGTALVEGFYQLIEAGHEAVMIDADLAGSVAADRVFHVGVFQNDQADAALGTQVVVVHVPGAHFAAGLTIVGSHGGHGDAVFDGSSFDGDRFENLRIICFHVLSPFLDGLG